MPQKDDAQNRRENDGRIIEDGNVARRRKLIRQRDAELSDRRKKTGQQQINQLFHRHRLVKNDEKRQQNDGREKRKVKDDRIIFFFIAEHPQERVCRRRKHRGSQTAHIWHQIDGKRRLDDE